MIGITGVLSVAILTAAGDYTISVDSLGLGNSWRPGDITPINLTVTSTDPEPSAAWIAWEVPDGDGDIVAWGRPITVTPNQDVSTWLYAPTQPWATGTTTWTIRLRRLIDSKPGDELASYRFSPASVNAAVISSESGAIAVFGTRRLGLGGLLGAGKALTLLEPTITVAGLRVEDLPSSWPCFDSFDTLVWADASCELNFRQAKAIEDWVSRGGHLVIILPTIGNPWSLGSLQGPLASMLGDLHPTIENTPVSSLQDVLGKTSDRSNLTLSVRVFDDTLANKLFSLPDGRCIAVTKDVGIGMCTVIGVDLADGRLAALGLPLADVFWNRVLGRRGDTPSPTQLQELDDLDMLSGALPKQTTLPLGSIAAQTIAMSTTAGGRLGTVFVLVIAYLITGGPAAFFVLRRRKKLRWSWMWFAVTAIVFTATTWVLAMTSSSVQTPLKHLSFIDQVYGAPRQQARGWFSLYLPNYATNQISISGNDNLLMPWTPVELSKTPSFADTRHVSVNIDKVPAMFDQPSRATTSNFQFNWAGGLRSDAFKSLIRVAGDSLPNVRRLENGTPLGLSGSIVNKMNVPLDDVTVIWITDARTRPARRARNEHGDDLPWINFQDSGKPLNIAYTWRLSDSWEPGEQLSLHAFVPTQDALIERGLDERYRQEKRWDAFSSGGSMPRHELYKRLEMLTLYSHLKPPVYQKQEGEKQSPPNHHVIRRGGRNLDLASWFARECIIVIGFVQHVPIPIAVEVDGEEIQESNGMAMLRWVYPLDQTP